MQRLSHTLLPALLLALSACSPACTPPEAKEPEPKQRPVANAATEEQPSSGAAAKDEMITEAKGVDLSKLAESQRASFFQLINTEPSACGKPHSLARSLRDDAQCRDSLVLAQFIADRLAKGVAPSALKDEIQSVAAALRPREINIEGRPVYGNERAPVTVVVFADFQCPHCKEEAPVVRQAVDRYRGRAKLVFKHFPLGGHPRAKAAAIATEAAAEQGKFWEMHDIVFANQTQLEENDILRYAQRIGLDMDRFKASYEAKKGQAAVEADRAEGEKLGISGTPAVFINGRQYMPHPDLFGGTVAGWIDDALKR